MIKAKRILSTVLAICMICALFAGCSNAAASSKGTESSAPSSTASQAASSTPEKKDPVTLAWWFRGNGEQTDTDLVNDKVNEMLKSYAGLEHVTLELHPFAPSDYSTQVTLGLSSGAQIDILNTVSLVFGDLVNEGVYRPLDSFMSAVPELQEALPDWFLAYGQVNGEQYMIPHYQQAANGMSFTVPKEYVDKGYIDLDQIRELFSGKTTTKHTVAEKYALLEAYVKTVREKEGRKNVYADYLSINGISNLSNEIGYYDLVSGYTSNTFYITADEHKVCYLDTAASSEEIFALAARWYDEGITYKDTTVKVDDLKKGHMMDTSDAIVYTFSNGTGDAEYLDALQTSSWGFETATVQLSDYYAPASYGAGGDGITVMCKKPEDALKFIECMDIERGKEIYNTIVYGIEGTHWEWVDQASNTIKTFGYDSSQGGSDYLYSAHKWIMGNTFNAYLNQGCNARTIEIAKEINESSTTIHSDLSGLIFDTTAISTQMDQISAIYKEYHDTLSYGTKGVNGWKAYYDEYVTKLNTAGLEQVIAELQKQVDAFLK